MSFLECPEDIRWTQGFKRPEKEQFGIYQRRGQSKPSDGFYLVDWEKKTQLGKFDRQHIFRAYIRANSWMEAGDPQSWNFGYYVCFSQHQPVQGQFQEFQNVNPKTVSPALALYKWTENFPIAFGQTAVKSLPSGQLKELAQLYPILEPIGSLAIGILMEARNFHQKGALVLSHSQKPGDTIAIIDEIENYPELKTNQ